MPFLEEMRAFRREMQLSKHPLCNVDASVRYAYVLGIALLVTRADEESNPHNDTWLLDFASSMDLPESVIAKIRNEARHAEALVLHKIIPSILCEPRIHDHFMSDLTQAAAADGGTSERKSEMVDEFKMILEAFSKGEPDSHESQPIAEQTGSRSEQIARIIDLLHYRCLLIRTCSNRL